MLTLRARRTKLHYHRLSLSLSLEISRKIVYTNDFIRSISFACLVTRETINNVNVTEAHLFYTLF